MHLRPDILLNFFPDDDTLVKAAGGEQVAKLGVAPRDFEYGPLVTL